MKSSEEKLSLRVLIALVMGSMIGSGMFALPSTFAMKTGAFGAIIAWCIAGFGMLMLALVFQNLSQRKPELESGIYAYPQAGFGNFMGFSSAMGYWIGCCLADVACLVLIKATLGKFFPVFGDGTTFVALVSASILLWAVHFLILRGIKEAAILNTIATVAKIVPIFIFIIVTIYHFNSGVFSLNFWGDAEKSMSSVFGQVRNTLLITVFVFVGIEGASVYSRFAKDRKDVGIATVLGFLGVLCLLILVTVPAYGILPREEMASLPTPSMAGVFMHMVGTWGAVFISVGLLIAVLGNYLSWSLLAAEVLYSAAKDETVPAFLAKENDKKAPIAALLASNIVIQAFLLITPFAEYAFQLTLKMTSAMTLIPYFLISAYSFKLAFTGETYEASGRSRRKDFITGALASLYTAGMVFAGGTRYLLLSAILYCMGTILFFIARKEQKKQIFTLPELFIFSVITVLAIYATYALSVGIISI